MYQLCIKFFVNYYYFSLLLIFNQNKMKKLTYLFLALIIVACSSDDSSDGNQLFLEKYDGVVWDGGIYGMIAFDNNIPKKIIYGYVDDDGNDVCYTQPLDGSGTFSDGRPYIYAIEQETENSLTRRRTYETSNGTPILDRWVYTVSSDDNTLTESYLGAEPFVFTRTDDVPCE